MVEKVDRPKARSNYEIREAKETKEDQHHQHNPKEEMEKQYKKQLDGDGKEWSKFGQRSTVIKPVKVDTNRVAKMLFKMTSLYKGIGILQVDVIWKDGRKTRSALIRLKKMEDFFKLKKLTHGDEVPRNYWASEEQIEIGIIQSISASGPFPMSGGGRSPKREDQAKPSPLSSILMKLGILKADTKKANWGIIAFYLFLIVVITVAIYTEVN